MYDTMSSTDVVGSDGWMDVMDVMDELEVIVSGKKVGNRKVEDKDRIDCRLTVRADHH